MPKNGLTALQARFVAEYPIDLNATQAARRAGAQGSDAVVGVTAHKWLKTPKIRARLAEQEKPRLQRARLDAQVVLDAIGDQVNADIRELYDKRGHIKPIHQLTKVQAAMIAGVEMIMKNATAGDGKIDRVLKVKLVPRDRYVEMAAKHFKLLTEVVAVLDGEKMIKQLNAGRDALAAIRKAREAKA